jgi:hypothetical protein
MNEPLPMLMENSIQIAWDYLEATGELGDGHIAARFLMDSVEMMIRRGERRKLLLQPGDRRLPEIPGGAKPFHARLLKTLAYPGLDEGRPRSPGTNAPMQT